jgi:hypothetical protein
MDSYKNMTIVCTKRQAGFGSIFIQALDWLWYSEHTKIPVYIYWDECGNNQFDLFFDQKNVMPKENFIIRDGYYASYKESEEDERRINELDMYEKYKNTCLLCCNPFVYRESSFAKFRKILNQVMNNNLNLKIKGNSIPDNTLGVHCRRRDHYTVDGKSTPMSTIISLEDYYKQNIYEMKQEFESGGYDYIYVACNVKKYYDIILNEFQDKVISLDYDRWNDEILDQNDCSSQGYAIALLDKLNLAKCKFILGNVSNFTLTTLVLNPTIPFKLFNTIKDCYGM